MIKHGLTLGLIAIFFACTYPTSIDKIEEPLAGEKNINLGDLKEGNQNITTLSAITVTATRIGGSGTGRDIVARDDTYILGESNKRVYKYDSANDTFVLQGGGTGKRISATSNKVLLCGNDDKIYYRNMSSTGSWTHLSGSGSSKCKDIVGDRDDTALSNESVFIISNDRDQTYYWSNSLSNWIGMSINVFTGQFLTYATDISLSDLNILLRSNYSPCAFCPIWSGAYLARGRYSLTPGYPHNGWTPVDNYGSHDVAGSSNHDYYIDIGRRIVNASTGQVYTVTGRSPDRLSIGNDGTVYFIDNSNNGIYKFTP